MSLENAKTIIYPELTFKQEYKIDTEGNIYEYSVTKACISHIKQKRTWKYITEKYNFN
jgi:hypothetical protein